MARRRILRRVTERITTGSRFLFVAGDLPLAKADPPLLYLQGATGDLEREANAYKQLAGFDLATPQALSRDREAE